MNLKFLFYTVTTLFFLAITGLIAALGGYLVAGGGVRNLAKQLLNMKTQLVLAGAGVLALLVVALVIYFQLKQPYRKTILFSLRKKLLMVAGLVVVAGAVTLGSSYLFFKNGNSFSHLVITSNNSANVDLGGGPDYSLLPTRTVLEVNYQTVKAPFTNQMLGVGLVNWDHAWGKPYPGEVKGLAQALKAAHVGLIRYAGGNWANSVGWDRKEVRAPYTGFPDEKNGPYWFQYNPAEIDSVAQLAKEIGADVLVQVNISTSDPAMWADMVKYTNVEHNYGFKYWELGNELDADKNAPSPTEYAKRVGLYLDAMLKVDPSIKIVAGVPASPFEAIRQNYSENITELSQYLTKSFSLTSSGGRKVQALSYHWYQACNSEEQGDLTRYGWDGLSLKSWRNAYSRVAAEITPQRISQEITKNGIPQGITELNFDACNYDNPMNGNFLNALWSSDVIGRLAYNGLNFATRYTGFGSQAYSLLNYADGQGTDKLSIRPAYYAYIMYAQYFGNQLVESKTNDSNRLTIWASRDTNDPAKLKLMITNLSGTPIQAPVSIPGFKAASANLYQLTSADPTNISTDSLSQAAAINGVSLDPMSVADSLSKIKPVTLSVSGSSFDYTFPAYSSTAIVLSGEFGPVPTADPNAQPTPTIGFLPTPTATPVPSYKISATTSTPSVSAGQPITITGTVAVDVSGATLLVNTEVYCSADNKKWDKDFQKFYDKQVFTPGQAQTFTNVWEIPKDHPKADCAIKMGLYTPGWGKALLYNDVGTFKIEAKN